MLFRTAEMKRCSRDLPEKYPGYLNEPDHLARLNHHGQSKALALRSLSWIPEGTACIDVMDG